MDIPTFLLKLRQSSALSQKYVADSLGVTASTVSRWETGQNDIGLRDFIGLMKLYGQGAYSDFTSFLQSSGIDVISEIDPEYYNRVEEARAKYERESQKKERLNDQLEALNKEIEYLKKIQEGQEEQIRLQRKLLG